MSYGRRSKRHYR